MNTLEFPILNQEKWGCQGIELFFLFWLKNMDCWYLLELPHRGSSNKYQQFMFGADIRKISLNFKWKKFFPWAMKASIILHRYVNLVGSGTNLGR